MARGNPKSRSRICHFVTCFLFLPIIIIMLGVSLATDNWLIFKVNRELFSTKQLKITSDKNNLELARIAYNRTVGMFWECYTNTAADFLRKSSKGDNEDCFKVQYTVPEVRQEKPLTLEFWQHLQLKRARLSTLIIALVFASIAFIVEVCVWKYEHHCIGIFACISIVFTAFMICMSITSFHAMEFIEFNTITDKAEIHYHKNWPLFIKDATIRSYGVCYALVWTAMALCMVPAFLLCLVTFQFKAENYNKLKSDYDYHQSDVSTVMKSSTNYSPVAFGQKNNLFIIESNTFDELEGRYVKS